MGKLTGIAWCHHTFNPWWGCTKVSEECRFCYAERWDRRMNGQHWGPTAPRRMFGEKHWREPLHWNANAAEERRRVFCASMADVLEDHIELQAPRARLWNLMRETPNLDWLLLTKREEQILNIPGWVLNLRNLWLGVSAGTAMSAALRIPTLLSLREQFPRLILWVSAEPLLSPFSMIPFRGIDWLIIGGENTRPGTLARPLPRSAAQALISESRQMEIAVFMKQFGSHPANGMAHPAGSDPAEWPEWARIREFPRKR